MNNKYTMQYPSNSYNNNLNRYYTNLNHSNSQPNLYSNYKKSPLTLSGQEILSNYYHHNNNRVADKLKQDNLIAHKQLNDLTNEYDNMKIFLKDKVNQMEQNQQKQFENLINYLKNNRNEYDERRIKEEISDEFKKQRELKNERFKNFIKDIEKRRVNVNIERSKLYEDLYYYNEIQKINLLQNDLKRHNNNKRNNYNNQRISTHNLYPRYNIPYTSPPIYLKNNYEKNRDNELIKLFVLRELMEGNKKSHTHPHIQNIPPTKYKYPQPIIQPIYQPPPMQQPQIQVQSRYIPQPQPIPVPQPIIIQSPPAMPSPNIIIQPDRGNNTEQLKKLLISPNVTKFSEHKKQTTKKISNQSKRTKTKYMNTEEKEPQQEKKKTEKRPEKSKKEEEEEKKEEEEEKEEEEKEEEEEDDEEEEEEEDDDSSSREIILRLYDPDDENYNKVIYPNKNKE